MVKILEKKRKEDWTNYFTSIFKNNIEKKAEQTKVKNKTSKIFVHAIATSWSFKMSIYIKERLQA